MTAVVLAGAGMGTVIVGLPLAPIVVKRRTIGSFAYAAYGLFGAGCRAAGAGFRLGMAAIALAGTGMGAVIVGLPFAPIVIKRSAIGSFAYAAYGLFGAGCRAAGAGFRLGMAAVVLACAGVLAVTVGLPLAPIVVKRSAIGSFTYAAYSLFGAGRRAAGMSLQHAGEIHLCSTTGTF